MRSSSELLADIYVAAGISNDADESLKLAALERGLQQIKDHIRRTAPSIYATEFVWRRMPMSEQSSNEIPICPKCGSKDFMSGAPVDAALDENWKLIRTDKSIPFPDGFVRCGCGSLWHESDLVGKRRAHLETEYGRERYVRETPL